jgi:ADP-heptose:LPS heptosyltransferase
MIKSVLIFSHGELIGDGMMKLPFINALKDAFPGAEITWLSGVNTTIFATALAPIVEGKLANVVSQSRLGVSVLDVLCRRWRNILPRDYYDVIIDTEHQIIPTFLLKTIPHKKFISASMKWLWSDARPPLKQGEVTYKRPILLMHRLMDLLNAATGRTISPVFGMNVPDAMTELAKGLLPAGKTILLAPGAGGRFKCWPFQNFVDLGNRLVADGFNVGYVLGPAETEWQSKLKEGVPNAFFPLQETTEKSVYVTIALAKLVDVSVANDGGVGHIFASSDNHVISMWGPTDPKKSTPNGKNVHVMFAGDYGVAAMETLTVDIIYTKIKEILEDK